MYPLIHKSQIDKFRDYVEWRTKDLRYHHLINVGAPSLNQVQDKLGAILLWQSSQLEAAPTEDRRGFQHRTVHVIRFDRNYVIHASNSVRLPIHLKKSFLSFRRKIKYQWS